MKTRILLIAFALFAAPSFASAQIVIESANEEKSEEKKEVDPEKPVDSKTLRADKRFVEDAVFRSDPLVHGVQLYARGQDSIVPGWREAVRLQVAAHHAFQAKQLKTAVLLTLRAREAARNALEAGKVASSTPVPDTERELEYVEGTDPDIAQDLIDRAQTALPDSELDPTLSLDEWRWMRRLPEVKKKDD